MSKTTVVNEMCTYRLPVTIVDHLAWAASTDDRSKTSLVKRALSEMLERDYPGYVKESPVYVADGEVSEPTETESAE